MEKKGKAIVSENNEKTIETAVEQLTNIFVAFIDEQNSNEQSKNESK